MPFTTSITGLGPVEYTGNDNTNPALIEAFMNALSQFYNVKVGTAPLTQADLTNIQNQITFLTNISQNGISINLNNATPGNPTAGGTSPGTEPNQTYYLTTQMVQALDALFTSVAPSGNISSLTLQDLTNWRNGTTTQNANDIQNIFVYAARVYAILPPLTPGGATSSISLVPSTAAKQISRIFSNSTFVASDINLATTQSIQAYTELEYVETANQVINEQLQNLQQELQTTQDSLNNLNQLQQLHNNITVNSRTFTLNLNPSTNSPTETLSTYVATYENFASAELKQALVPQLNSEQLPFLLPASAVTYSARITNGKTGPEAAWAFTVTIKDPSKYYAFNVSTNKFSAIKSNYTIFNYYVSNATVNPATFTQAQAAQIAGSYNGTVQFPLIGTLSGIQTIQVQLVRQQAALSTLLVELSAVTPASTLLDPLKRSQALIGEVSAVYTQLKNDVGTYTSTSPTLTAAVGVRNWLMDNYQTFSSPSATNAGLIQQNITNAINAAQSSNSTQTQNVNNSLLVFQQYYQSAAAVLTQLTQIINSMAKNISP